MQKMQAVELLTNHYGHLNLPIPHTLYPSLHSESAKGTVTPGKCDSCFFKVMAYY